jgi:hypothetical protein
MDGTINLTELERRVLEMLLAGDHPVLGILRAQFPRAKVVQREFTGVGFSTHFEIPSDVARLPDQRSFELGDVHADMPGLEAGVDFILFIREGAIDFLEGFTYGDDAWPAAITAFTLSYDQAMGGRVVSRGHKRDWPSLYRVLGT